MSDVLVSAEWLAAHLDQVRVLDVRGEVAAEPPRYRAHPDRYREGHVPGAVFVDWRSDFTDRASAVLMRERPPLVVSPLMPMFTTRIRTSGLVALISPSTRLT